LEWTEILIKDPPLLTIGRSFPRPRPEELAAFAGVPTGYVVDALGGRGALDHRIKPLAPASTVMVGTAVTCHCGPADNLALFAALDVAGPGDILIAATDGFTATCVTGDLMLGMAKNRGVRGLVTDGLVRDIAGIAAVGLPVYCAGVTPNSPVRNGPGTIGLPVVMGGVTIESGDLIIGDNDGIVVIPRSRVGAVLKRLPDIRAAEATLEAKVKAGLEVPDFIRSILDSDRVVEI
jgi:4-hydroxy-4-methyl-2-oxoglutarate aldolase